MLTMVATMNYDGCRLRFVSAESTHSQDHRTQSTLARLFNVVSLERNELTVRDSGTSLQIRNMAEILGRLKHQHERLADH